jgi:hypothetical protein
VCRIVHDLALDRAGNREFGAFATGMHRGYVQIMQTNTSKLFPGDGVHIVAHDDDTEILHTGAVVRVPTDGYVAIRVDGEDLVHEWPVVQVWPEWENRERLGMNFTL